MRLKIIMTLLGAISVLLYVNRGIPSEGMASLWLLMIIATTLVGYIAWNIRLEIDYARLRKRAKKNRKDLFIPKEKLNEVHNSYLELSRYTKRYMTADNVVLTARDVLTELGYSNKEIKQMLSDALQKRSFKSADELLKFIYGAEKI